MILASSSQGLAALLVLCGGAHPPAPPPHVALHGAPSTAPPRPRPWRPTGAAVGVTGAVNIGPQGLTAAGAAFPLRTTAVTDKAIIFQVTAPVNPLLVNRNRLCGPRPPTWIVATPIAPNGLQLAVFTTTALPTGADSPGVCATYFYER